MKTRTRQSPYYAHLRRAEPVARLGAAGALDVAVAAAEVQAGGVAVRGCEEGARRLAQHGAGGPDRAPQPDHGQSDRGQHLRHHAASRRRLSMRDAGRPRAHAPPFGGGAAAGAARQGRRLHHRQRHPHRHAAGRGAADAGVLLARPRQRDRARPATGSTSSTFRSSSSPRRCSSSRIRRAASRRSPAPARRRCASPRARRSAPAATPRRSRSPRASCRRSRSI